MHVHNILVRYTLPAMMDFEADKTLAGERKEILAFEQRSE